MKKLILTALAAGIINCVWIGAAGAAPVEKQTPPTAVFAWDGVKDGDVDILAQHNIKAVFLDINHTDSIPTIRDFNIFLLAGDTNWGVEEMKATVDKATALGAAGIVLDVEGDYEALAGELEKLNSRGLPIYVCIPYWLDDVNLGVLERIVRAVDCCVVMDYDRRNESQQMEEEIKLAKRYNKSLYHAIELQKPGVYGLTPINTYFGAGRIRAAEEKYREEFGDTAVGFAIHSLEMLRGKKPAADDNSGV